ncbi:MAG: nucleoside triphosphate pyrophosphohydrolase [Deltaproteobacteria bacterium]|nr:nucleoside triphosphate pyrophosphohydrolase [Deltaproteobacteria bacterium]
MNPHTKFKKIIAQLRDPENGCPWDLKQTHESLKPYLIEESYEVIDAIDNHPEKICEELGDVLLQVYLHAQIASDMGTFTIEDIFEKITEKMIVRHPHIFGDVQVSDADEVRSNWEQIKQAERKEKKSLLDDIPKSLPSLEMSHKFGEKASRVNFDWPDTASVKEKIKEELQELLEASEPELEEEEFGDLLFVLSQYARKMGFHSEIALLKACSKFKKRFRFVEETAGDDLGALSLNQLEKLWKTAKTK